MRLLCIPDIHLHLEIFDRADKILASGQADRAIQLGDLVDDWGQQFNLSLYTRTLQRAIQFQKDHPDTLWVLGNHDLTYWHPHEGMSESGHSKFAEEETLVWLKELERQGGRQRVMHVIDGCIFTHAGLAQDWIARHTPALATWDDELEFVHSLVDNLFPGDLWEEDSPIWARPQHSGYEMYPCNLQIVGHTPVKSPYEENGVLSVDTFSTRSDGTNMGDCSFVIVDTEIGGWQTANETECEYKESDD